jgi:large subunit ribosomal protein L15
MAEELNLTTLKPAQARKDRKRVGRGLGSGKGRYSGRGIKGQKSRAGSKKMAAGFEGGQMPIDMRLPKLRGNTSADAMPIGPFRTYSQPINLRDLDRVFDDGATVDLEALVEKGLLKNTKTDVKILGTGDLSKKLSVTAHGFSASAREKIEAAGGSVTALKEPKVRKRKSKAKPKPAAEEPEEAAAEATEPEAPAAEAEAPAEDS